MRFSSFIYFIISMNVALFLASTAGIWHPVGLPPMGLNPEQLTTTVLLGVGYAGLTLLIGALGVAVVTSAYFSSEKVLMYTVLGGIYGTTTGLTTTLIESANMYIGTINLSTVFSLFMLMIFLVFIIQTVFGGFKAYE